MALQSTWETRELPVLEAIVRLYDETGRVSRFKDVVEASGLIEEEVEKALRALDHETPPLTTKTQKAFGGAVISVGAPTGAARRAVGAWPTPENLADRIVAALQDAADQAQDPDEKTRLKKGAEAVGGVGKSVLTGVLTHVITQGM